MPRSTVTLAVAWPDGVRWWGCMWCVSIPHSSETNAILSSVLQETMVVMSVDDVEDTVGKRAHGIMRRLPSYCDRVVVWPVCANTKCDAADGCPFLHVTGLVVPLRLCLSTYLPSVTEIQWFIAFVEHAGFSRRLHQHLYWVSAQNKHPADFLRILHREYKQHGWPMPVGDTIPVIVPDHTGPYAKGQDGIPDRRCTGDGMTTLPCVGPCCAKDIVHMRHMSTDACV